MRGDVVYAYVLDAMADWEPAFVLAELNGGRFFRPGAPRLCVRTCSLGGAEATTMGGLRIRPDLAAEDVDPARAALLLLPGGMTWTEPRHAPVVEKARACLAAGVPVAAICGATLALAQAGLLDDRDHTSNDPDWLAANCPAYRGRSRYRVAPAVTDRDLVTAGGTAALDFAAHVLRRLDVFAPETLAAWLNLHRTHDAAWFAVLARSVSRGAAA